MRFKDYSQLEFVNLVSSKKFSNYSHLPIEELLKYIMINGLDEVYEQVSKLIRLVLTLPLSAASIEAGPSTFHRTKSFLKSTMSDSSLTCLSTLVIETKLLSEMTRDLVFKSTVTSLFEGGNSRGKRVSVPCKINNLRSAFRKELKKIKKRNKGTGSGPQDVYVPKLWYFDLLGFLRDQDIHQPSITNIDGELEGVEALSSGPSSVPENEVESEPDESERWIHAVGAEVSSPKMKKRQSKLSEERQNCCDNHSNQANQSVIPQKQDDKLNALALAVSKKLRKMDCHQQMYAENVINRALFFGSMGLLTAFSDGHPTSSHNTGSTSSLPPEKQRKLVTRKHPKTLPGPKNAPEELLELTFIKEEPSTSDNEVALYEPTFVDVSVPSTIEDGPFIKSEPPETITAESPDETFSKYSEPTCTQSPQEVQSCMTSKNNSSSNTSLRPSEPALEPPPLVLLNKSSPRASISGKSTEQRNPKKKRSLQEANDGNETLQIFQTDVPEAEVRVRVAELQVEQMKKEYEVKMKNQQIIAEQFKKEHEAKMKEHELKMKKVKGQIVEMEFRCQEMMKQSVIENKVHELTVMDLEQKLSTSQIIHELTIQELKQKLYNSQLEQQILEKKLNAHPS
uniref:Uncharacterized protein n=1 Tax=Timema monikensis TaxID=170555 RepID=A0A7R9DYT1_9NEOP|nr:unnamed protein product [Timema monikensis]